MQFLKMIILGCFILVGSNAQAQLSTEIRSSGIYQSYSGWEVVPADRYATGYYNLSALASQLGCFPTSAQVPEDTESLRVGDHQRYSYYIQHKGIIKPGESFKIEVHSCAGAGVQPILQLSVRYQNIRKSLVLTGVVIDPDGVVRNAYHPLTTLQDKVMWGGIGPGEGKPGKWTVILSNKTKSSIEIYGAAVSVTLQ